jgi:hypothetical protein
MAVVDTKYITAANFYSIVGYAGSNFPGTVSETSGGSQDNNLDDLYSGADMYSFYSSSTQLNLYIDDNSSNVTNSGWDFVKIGTASFNRTDATYTQDSSTGRDNWRWTVTSNPFVNGTTYAISFETTSSGGGGGGGSGYGFQQFDASGNLVIDSSAPVKTFVVYEQGKSIYVNAPYSGSTSYTDVTVPGVTSQQDLDDNYVFIRRDGGAFSIWGASTTHGYAYQSANTVRFTWRGTCETFNIGGGSSSRPCNQFDAHTQLFDIIILGKDLS